MKYSLPEIERRWLVDPRKLPELTEPTIILDRYIEAGRLRLRRMYGPDGPVYKLCKKYPGQRITNIYLDESEYNMLAGLPARQIEKKRYRIEEGALDIYEFPTAPIAIFEREFLSMEDARSFQPPSFVLREVGSELSGFCIAKNPSLNLDLQTHG